MASPVEATVLLCDAAQADYRGKLHMLGAGWDITTTPTPPQAVAVLVRVPWDRANQKLSLTLTLVNADGEPVELEGAEGPVGAKAELEVGRPPGVAHGSPLSAAFALNLGPMPLPPGRYEWRLEIADSTASTSFQVMEHPPS